MTLSLSGFLEEADISSYTTIVSSKSVPDLSIYSCPVVLLLSDFKHFENSSLVTFSILVTQYMLRMKVCVQSTCDTLNYYLSCEAVEESLTRQRFTSNPSF